MSMPDTGATKDFKSSYKKFLNVKHLIMLKNIEKFHNDCFITFRKYIALNNLKNKILLLQLKLIKNLNFKSEFCEALKEVLFSNDIFIVQKNYELHVISRIFRFVLELALSRFLTLH